MTSETTTNMSYNQDENTIVDTTRGNLLTDVQMSAESVPMTSTVKAMALNDTTTHDIKSILERPVNLGTFAWNSSDKQIDILLSVGDYDADTTNYLQKFDFPQAIFEKSPLFVDKLKNYQYLKADVEIEVKVNAQAFLQGAMMMVYNPYYDQTGDFRRKGTRFLASQTSCPHKILNLEEGNSMKITCPYANIYDLFDLNNVDNQFGTIFIYAFDALKGASASESCNYTVFARFINPEFYVPSSNQILSKVRDEHDIRRLTAKGYRVAQSAVTPKAAKDTGEVAATGPVSKIASGVTTISDVLSDVPIIGSVASSVSWVSRVIGKTAASLGWSKPTSIVPQTKSVIKPNHTMVHTEGNDDAVTLALIQDNGIDSSSFVAENVDEMSLKHILAKPNFFHSQTASNTLFSGNKLITSWEVSPFSQYQYGDAQDSQTLYLGSFAYASMMATFWRGSINYDIMVIKTPFHQGRFAVVYFPETNIADVPSVLTEELNTNYNVICTLKDRQDEPGRTRFRVSVPYMTNTGWRETYKSSTNETNPGPDATTLDTKIGCLAIYSLVDLSFPPTVSPSVTFYVSHSAGDDYQLARPANNLVPGFQSRYAQSDVGTAFIPEDENLLVPQHKSEDVTAQTTGEYFTSLRALVKRFGYFANLGQTNEYVSLRTRHFTEDPHSGARIYTREGLNTLVSPTPWYMATFLYRFYSGSSQLKLIPYTAGLLSEAYLSFDEDTLSEKELPQSDVYGQPLFAQLQQVSNAFEVRSPWYRGVRKDVVSSKQVPVLGDVRTNLRCRNLANYGGNTQPSMLFEAGGDDFNLDFGIGPPPMCDRRNFKLTTTFPSGFPTTMILSDVDTIGGSSETAVALDVRFDPAFPAPSGNTIQFFTNAEDSFVAFYNDGTTETILVKDTELRITTEGTYGIAWPIPAGKTVDDTPTIASIRAVAFLSVTVNVNT